jgi:hypothetical protein
MEINYGIKETETTYTPKKKKGKKTGIKVSFTLKRKIIGNKYLKEDQRSIQQSYIS